MQHIIPENDSKLHTLSLSCGCLPVLSDDIIIHNSFDGREIQEIITEEAMEGKNWAIFEEQ